MLVFRFAHWWSFLITSSIRSGQQLGHRLRRSLQAPRAQTSRDMSLSMQDTVWGCWSSSWAIHLVGTLHSSSYQTTWQPVVRVWQWQVGGKGPESQMRALSSLGIGLWRLIFQGYQVWWEMRCSWVKQSQRQHQCDSSDSTDFISHFACSWLIRSNATLQNSCQRTGQESWGLPWFTAVLQTSLILLP